MRPRKRSEPAIRSVSKALELLELVVRSSGDCGVKELARETGSHPSTVSRLLSTLSAYGFLRQDRLTGRYRGGFKILELSSHILKKLPLRDAAAPFLLQLMRESGETTNLVVLDGAAVVYIDCVENAALVTTSSRVGRRLPAHCTAAGKVLLAFHEGALACLPDGEFPRYTDRTITTRERLLEELERVRRQGYAVDDEEQETGLRCVAAPVRNHQGEVVAAVSISGPTVQLSDHRLAEVIPLVVRISREISARLGYTP